MLNKIIRNEHGQDLVEYGLLASFVSIAAVLTLQVLSGLVLAIWDGILTEIQ